MGEAENGFEDGASAYGWDVLSDPALLGLLDTPPPLAFDAITRLAVSLFDTPVALVSVVREREDRQYFTSAQGLPGPWCDTRQTPLSHSFCQHVKNRGEPLVVADAREDAMLHSNLAVRDLDVVAYLGVPINGPDGRCLGALCVISDQPRKWTPTDVARLSDLACCVNDEILLRATMLKTTETYTKLQIVSREMQRYSALRETVTLSFMAPDLTMDQRFQALLGAGCAALDMKTGSIVNMGGGVARILFHHPQPVDPLASPLMPPVAPPPLLRMADKVIAGEHLLIRPDLSEAAGPVPATVAGMRAAAYAGAPLLLNGAVFGVLEFASATPRPGWSDVDSDLVSVISMCATAYLGAFQQIDLLKKTAGIPPSVDGLPSPQWPISKG